MDSSRRLTHTSPPTRLPSRVFFASRCASITHRSHERRRLHKYDSCRFARPCRPRVPPLPAGAGELTQEVMTGLSRPGTGVAMCLHFLAISTAAGSSSAVTSSGKKEANSVRAEAAARVVAWDTRRRLEKPPARLDERRAAVGRVGATVETAAIIIISFFYTLLERLYLLFLTTENALLEETRALWLRGAADGERQNVTLMRASTEGEYDTACRITEPPRGVCVCACVAEVTRAGSRVFKFVREIPKDEGLSVMMMREAAFFILVLGEKKIKDCELGTYCDCRTSHVPVGRPHGLDVHVAAK